MRRRLSGVLLFLLLSLFVIPQAAEASFTDCPANTSPGNPLTMNLTEDECTLETGAAGSALSDDLIQIQIVSGSSTNFFIFDPSANDTRDLVFNVNNGSDQGTLDADGGSLTGINCAAGCTVSGTHGGTPFSFVYTASGGGGSLDGAPEIDDLSSSTGNTVADGGTDTIATAINSGTATTITYDVSNSGSETLTLSGLTLGTPTNASFGSTSIDTASVASGGTETDAISITFTPSSTTDGAGFSVPFSFTTNDADDGTDETTFNVTISGTINAEAEISDLTSSTTNTVSDGGSDAQGTVASGSAQTLTYTITNTGTADLTVATATSSSLNNVTVNSVGAPGSTTVTAAGGTTQFNVQYTPTAAGAFSFDVSFVSSDADEDPFDFTISGTATEAPGFSQAIAPGTILADGAATVTFTIDNSANAAAATALDFSNSLPAGVEVAAAPNGSTTCAGGTLTASGGGSTISYSGGTVSAGASCSVQADVTAATDGSYSNTSGDLTSSLGNSGTSSAPLTVASPEIDLQRPAATSLADGGTDAQGSVAVGVQQVLTYTVENTGTATLTLSGTPSSAAASNVSVDSISAPGTSSLAASASTTFTVAYTPTAAGAFSFELDVDSDDADEGTYDLTISGTATQAPGFSQAIAPGTILADGTATVTFTIDNSANATAATALDFTNTLPAGVEVAATPNGSTTCTGGTLTASGGGSTISYTGGTVSAGASCLVQADVTAATDGSYSNTSGDLTSSLGNSGPSSAPLTVASPEIDLQRPAATSLADGGTDAQGSVAVGVQQVLTYTVENTGTATLTLSGTPASAAASNVSVDSISAPGTSSLAASASTTFTVAYTPTAAGAFSFELDVDSDDADEGTYDLTISGTATQAPGFSQAIAPGTILADGTATVTFTIDNSANATAATALDFTNTLPAGVEVAATPDASSTCTGGTLTASGGGSTISYTGGTVSAGASCLVQADVTAATDGSYSNTSGDLTSSLGNSGPSSAPLTVASPEIDLQRPAATSLADGGTDAQGSVAVGVQQVLTYTVENTGTATLTLSGTPASAAASNVSVDSISAPGTSSLAASASTTFTVAYTPTAAGAFSFELDVDSDDADEGTYDLTISGTATQAPGFSQAIAPGTILADGTATVTFTIDNSANATAATALDFSNSLPAGVEVAAAPNGSTTCAGGTLTASGGGSTISYSGGTVSAGASCSVQADVTAATDGSYSNTSGDLTSSLGNSGTSSAPLTVASPEIDLQRPAATSLADGGTDAQGSVAVGVQQVLTYTVENTGTATLTLSGTPSSAAASNVSVDSISAPGTSSLAASASTTFTVAYTPTAAGAFSFELDVDSDDADEGTYDLTISGTATQAPGFSQAIAPGTILADGTATVTFTIDNSANATAATALDFTNTLPAGVEVAATPDASSTCTGGTLTASGGGSTISYTGGTVSAGASCLVQADVTAATDGSYSNTSGDLTSSLGNSGPSSAPLTVASPEIDLQRPAATSLADGGTDAQGSVAVGVQQVLTYTVENTGTATLTLSGTPSSTAASNVSVDSISAPGTSSLAASASTTFTVAYTPTAAGAFSFELDVDSDDADEGTYDLTISGTATQAPGFSQAIAPGTILADGTATVTFTIDNSANATAATALDFTNTLPAGVEVAATPDASSTCTGGTLTASGGGSTISYTGGTVSAGASCLVQADVTAATDGSYSNTSGDLTSSLGNSGPSSAPLTVASPEIDLQRPAATSLADGGTDAQGSVAVGVQQVLTYTVENTGTATLTLSGTPSSTAASNVSVDSISAPGTSSLAASASTTFTVAYTPTAAGAFSFELDVDSDDADEGTYDLTISGTATGSAEIGVGSSSGGNLEDGDTDTIPGTPSAGSANVITYTFTNSGSDTLNITTPTVAGNISSETNVVVNGLTLASNTVASGGGTTTLEISYTPQASGAYSFDLQVANTDADESLFNITVAGAASGTPEIEVSSSASGALSDGDTDSIAGVITPGTATSVTYTITNSGTDVLTLDAPSVASSISNQNNVTVDSLSLAATSVASGGGTTTLQVDYTAIAGGAYGFDLSLGSDDADEDPFDISVAGTAQSVASGLSLQSGSGQVAEVGAQFAVPLVARVTDSGGAGVAGVDVTFTAPASGASVVFASTGTRSETVTTGSDGTATSSAMTANETASSYAGGPTLTSYDVTASATGLSSVNFALTNDRDAEADIQKTQEVIAAFVSNRANTIVSNQPDLVSRLTQGGLTRQQGRNGFGLRATSNRRSATFRFSLRALLEEARHRNDGSRWRESLRTAEAGAEAAVEDAIAARFPALRFSATEPAGSETTEAPVLAPVIASGWDFWAEGTYAVTENGNFESRSGLFFAGVDYRWSDKVVLGVMGQLDITDEDNSAAGTSASGTGWMAGPYVVVRLDQNLYLDVAATYGQSSNTVNALGLFEDDFDTERFLLQGGLTGDFKLDARTTISPFARLIYYYEKQESYTDTLGRMIPSQEFDLGRFEFGPRVSWQLALDGNTQLSPYLSFSGIYDFNKLQGANPTDATLASSQSDFRGRLEAGATFIVPDRGIKIAFEGFYDGIGASDFESYGASLNIHIPF